MNRKTALEQLEYWIEQYYRINGTPTLDDIKGQINLLKDYEREQLHIADVMGSFKLKLQERLSNVKKDQTWDDWEEGIKFGREDMLEEIIYMIDKDYLNCP